VTELCASTSCPHGGAACESRQIVGPRHARPQQGLRVAPVPPKPADLTRLAHGRRGNGRSGRRNRRFGRTKEQPSPPHGLAATIVRRLQSSAQWWVRLTQPHTQKFGHSPVFPQIVYKLPVDVTVSPLLSDLDFSKLFDRLIIGPSSFPSPMSQAFTEALTRAGVPDAANRVFCSNIPIRS
jgi:hypothetical protein